MVTNIPKKKRCDLHCDDNNDDGDDDDYDDDDDDDDDELFCCNPICIWYQWK